MAKIRWHRTITRTVANGGEELINATGRQIVVVEATNTFLLSVDQEPFVELEKSFSLELADDTEFKSVRIRNESGASNTIKLQIGFTNIRDGRLGITGGISIAPADTLVTVADVSIATVTTALIVALNTDRRAVEVTNLSALVTLRIGDSNAGATRGAELAPGETRLFETSAALYGYNPSGAAVTVGVMELRN